MLDDLTYLPRDPRYKTPYGAVAAGTSVTFTLRPPRAGGFSCGVLVARFEFLQNKTVELPMPWFDTALGRDAFSATLETGDYVGLVWYSFRLEGLDGRCETLGEYQLTVYDGREAVPTWFGQGVSYQIFPDRFHRTCVPDPTGMPGGRLVHKGWDERPVHRPDGGGEIRNRDFFGGNLDGVMEKLPYLHELGVETIYFCPLFEAPENHRYGTADYERIDPMLGTNEGFSALCAAAHKLGMRVLMDGVFNHTGYVSRYFNGDGFYPTQGAAQGESSPYYHWFSFQHWPDKYDAWWGIYSLPAVNESEDSYLDYIIRGKDSIVRRWLRAGADGWRLDVADELPDSFICALHTAVREEKPDAVVIGEVWEDGTTKIAYDVRRRHVLGGHCDGLMNYPFRNALMDFLLGGDSTHFIAAMELIRENYPPFAFHSAMNFLGTHDTPRIFTQLGVGSPCTEQSRDWRADFLMNDTQRAQGLARLRLGALVLFSFPGSPTVYYGDEAGMEGFEDPFNRQTFPWGHENVALTVWYTALGRARRTLVPLREGAITYLPCDGSVLAFVRTLGEEAVVAAVNAGGRPHAVTLSWPTTDHMSGRYYGAGPVVIPPMSGLLLVKS